MCKIGSYASGPVLPDRPQFFGVHLITSSFHPSRADLADKLGVSRQTVNAIETEKYDPSLPLAFKIAKIFRKPVDEIFKRKT